MKIYCAHASGFDYATDFYDPISAANKILGFDMVLPHKHGAEAINSYDIIQQCDVMLAEISYPSTGMGIELGWATQFNKPIIAVHKHGHTPSSAINLITDDIIVYQNSADLSDILVKLWG